MKKTLSISKIITIVTLAIASFSCKKNNEISGIVIDKKYIKSKNITLEGGKKIEISSLNNKTGKNKLTGYIIEIKYSENNKEKFKKVIIEKTEYNNINLGDWFTLPSQ